MKEYKYIDLTYLQQNTNNNKALINELVDTFKEQIPDLIINFEEALTTKNWELLSKTAHKAKSSTGILGMKLLVEEMEFLQNKAKEISDEELFNEKVNYFKEYINNSLKEIDAYQKKI